MNDMLVLIEPLIPALRRYARALVHDRAAADDLVQDCMERAISRWHQRREDGDARTWMFTILHNLFINQMRQKQRRGQHVAVEDANDPALARPATQEDGLRHRDLMRALEALPEDQRSVVLLISLEDLSYAEAAKVLDIPIGTVMSRLSRGREKLRSAMEGDVDTTTSRGANLRRVK
jgi:RNA polymerase sigma-70 factor (ECF subfamily)